MGSITATPIDFSKTPLSGPYSPFFALIIDNVFTAAECASLITLASASTPWEPANTGAGREYAPTQTDSQNFRNSERILRDDAETADMIFERIRGFLSALEAIGPDSRWLEVTGKAAQKWSSARGETGFWRMKQLNPRLRFLRYGPGQYFKPHCDGLYEEPASQPLLKSFLTIHLYLNEGDGLEGGATRFWTPDKKAWLDVEPKMGRILVFQQRMLVHSGEQVTGGVKITMRTDVMFEKVIVSREERRAKAVDEKDG